MPERLDFNKGFEVDEGIEVDRDGLDGLEEQITQKLKAVKMVRKVRQNEGQLKLEVKRVAVTEQNKELDAEELVEHILEELMEEPKVEAIDFRKTRAITRRISHDILQDDSAGNDLNSLNLSQLSTSSISVFAEEDKPEVTSSENSLTPVRNQDETVEITKEETLKTPKKFKRTEQLRSSGRKLGRRSRKRNSFRKQMKYTNRKLIIIGDSSVGKTLLVSAFVGKCDETCEAHTGYMPTVGGM